MAPRDLGTTVMQATVNDVDRYVGAVAGLRIEAVRAGVGWGPNGIKSVTDGRVSANAAAIAFPTLVRTSVADDNLVLVRIESAPPGTHWCGRDVNSGEIFAYGPGTEHVGVNVPGLRFKFVVLGVEDLHQRADETGTRREGGSATSTMVSSPGFSGTPGCWKLPGRSQMCSISQPDRTLPAGASRSC